MKRCRRQCIEVRSADQSARSAENFFAFIFHFSGWALVAPSRFLHSKFQMYEDCRSQGRHELLFAHECNTYVHGGVY